MDRQALEYSTPVRPSRSIHNTCANLAVYIALVLLGVAAFVQIFASRHRQDPVRQLIDSRGFEFGCALAFAAITLAVIGVAAKGTSRAVGVVAIIIVIIACFWGSVPQLYR